MAETTPPAVNEQPPWRVSNREWPAYWRNLQRQAAAQGVRVLFAEDLTRREMVAAVEAQIDFQIWVRGETAGLLVDADDDGVDKDTHIYALTFLETPLKLRLVWFAGPVQFGELPKVLDEGMTSRSHAIDVGLAEPFSIDGAATLLLKVSELLRPIMSQNWRWNDHRRARFILWFREMVEVVMSASREEST